MNKKDPVLKLRYSQGMGDIITCILHSKYIGIIVHFLTKKNKPCGSCSERAYALNILFPIKMWKFFFKNFEERNIALKNDMIDFGYVFYEQKEEIKDFDFKYETKTSEIPNTVLNPITTIDYIHYDNYMLTKKEENDVDNIKTVLFVYQKIS